jgi:hypothetical protein
MKIDVVYVENSNGSSVESFSINDIESAKNLAANLYNYHGEPYKVVVINEESFNRKPKKVKLEKGAKFFLSMVNVLHRNAVTGSLESYGA